MLMGKIKAKWVSDKDWENIKKTIPIVCVDIIPFRNLQKSEKTLNLEIGLILRLAPIIKKWCFIGGRILKDETISDAIHRQLRETLGINIKYNLEKDPQPIYVAQYFGKKTSYYGFDPRQHAVGLTYFLNIEGEAKASGEALDFRWFNINQMPLHAEFGFKQDRILTKVLKLI